MQDVCVVGVYISRQQSKFTSAYSKTGVAMVLKHVLQRRARLSNCSSSQPVSPPLAHDSKQTVHRDALGDSYNGRQQCIEHNALTGGLQDCSPSLRGRRASTTAPRRTTER